MEIDHRSARKNLRSDLHNFDELKSYLNLVLFSSHNLAHPTSYAKINLILDSGF